MEIEKSLHERRIKAEKLDNWGLFDLQLWSDYPSIDQAVDALYDELSAIPSFKGNARIRKKHIKVVILDLYEKWLTDPTMYSGYRRGSNFYSELDERYNKKKISRMLIEIVGVMTKKGYAENIKGHYYRTRKGKSHIARVKATKKLISLLVDDFKIKPYMLGKCRGSECIILRDLDTESDAKVDIPYDDTPETIRMRQNLYAYNNLLRRSFIDIPHYPEEGVLSVSGKRKIKINRNNKFVRRVFNNGSWDDGGRFYGGWWQMLPKEWRQNITIDLEPVFEVDYSGLHIVILYVLEGIDYWRKIGKDPYKIKGYEDSERMRRLLKLVLLAAINATNKIAAIKAVRKHINFNKDEFDWVYESGISIGEMIEKFASEHEPIRRYFFSGYGIKLQRIDSKMAEYVIDNMTKYHLPVLCIHDSFITQVSCEDFLKDYIFEAIRYAMPSSIEKLGELFLLTKRKGVDEADLEYYSEHDFLGIHFRRELPPWELETIEPDRAYLDRLNEHNKKLSDEVWADDYYRESERTKYSGM